MPPHNVVRLAPRRHSTAQLQLPQPRTVFRYDPGELEFSDHGRDPRFFPGWWIAPSLLTALSALVCLGAYLR
jgi:hypothetical protein